MKSELEKLKDGTETDKNAKVDELSKYLETLTSSLAAKVNTTTAVASSTPSAPSTPTVSNGKLTDGFFVFNDESSPLYTFQNSSAKAKA
jgi:hypothetical protein